MICVTLITLSIMAKINITFFIPYYILKGYTSFSSFHDFFSSLPDYERKSKKIISISKISKTTLYEMPFCMYQMTKRRRHKSKLQLAHNS